MKRVGDRFELSATDLVGYLNCHHLAALDRAVAEGALPKPKVWDPSVRRIAVAPLKAAWPGARPPSTSEKGTAT